LRATHNCARRKLPRPPVGDEFSIVGAFVVIVLECAAELRRFSKVPSVQFNSLHHTVRLNT
jgi:hypothetical protein